MSVTYAKEKDIPNPSNEYAVEIWDKPIPSPKHLHTQCDHTAFPCWSTFFAEAISFKSDTLIFCYNVLYNIDSILLVSCDHLEWLHFFHIHISCDSWLPMKSDWYQWSRFLWCMETIRDGTNIFIQRNSINDKKLTKSHWNRQTNK